MASEKKLIKFYNNFEGIDLRSPEISQRPNAASNMVNAQFRETGALNKRKGYQLAAENAKGGYGSVVYDNVDDDGVVTEEVITIDENLYKMQEDSFTLTYTSGDGSSGSYRVYYDSDDDTFYFDLYDSDATRSLHFDMGNGYSGVNQTVTQTIAAIGAISGFAASGASTAGSTNATFIPLTADQVNLADGVAATITFKYLTEIPKPSTYDNPFSTFYSKRTLNTFENASFAALNNILYIATGWEALHKYDGLRVYKAGLPQPTAPTDGAGVGGSLTYTTAKLYQWKYTYIYKDAKGNQIESQPSEITDYTTTGASESRSITLTNLQETSGYNVSQAKVNGNQSGVNTITVDSGHGLLVGDYVYLQDGVTSSVVSRQVTAKAATTITIDGNAVNVADNAVISCILLTLYRTEGGGTLFYVSKELTNDTDNNTQAYDDGLADASLGAEFVEPIKPHGLPPTAKYVRAWRNQLVMAANNNVYYSDIENPEYFPPADNSFTTASTITALREADNIFYVWEAKKIYTVSGDFGTDQFEVDVISNDGTGCVAHNTVQSLGNVVWFLAADGIYMVSGSEYKEASEAIRPYFIRPVNTLSFKQAIAAVDGDKYLILLPNLPVDASYCSDTNSLVIVFDAYERHKAWYKFTNYNFMGGYCITEDETYLIRRSKPDATLYTHPMRILATETNADYCDHDQAIEFIYTTPWESLGEPAIFKKFLRIKLYSLNATTEDFEGGSFSIDLNQYGNFSNASIAEITRDFSGGSLGWGASEWGSFPWGSPILPDIKTKLSATKLKSVQFKFSNSNFNENVLISAYELEVAVPYRFEVKE